MCMGRRCGDERPSPWQHKAAAGAPDDAHLGAGNWQTARARALRLPVPGDKVNPSVAL